eukprot:TRINITY_DN22756_c0_g1_i1.p1 TRINITY_DN22756_c0_g1~~TRINITY_DN22756_c0_g1_i1.p1  ORF type:complete len:423 (+),score=166.04 TRINITY_DN22756_c0_g1_i1:51-1319(+)
MKRRLRNRLNMVGPGFVAPKVQSIPVSELPSPVEEAPVAKGKKTTVTVKSPVVRPASPKSVPAGKTPPRSPAKAAPKSILKRKRPADEVEAEKQAEKEEQQQSKRQKKAEAALLREAAAQLEAERDRDTLFIACGTYNSTFGGYNFNVKASTLTPVFAVKPQTGYVSQTAVNDKWLISASSDDTLSVFSSKQLRSVGSCGSEGTVTRMVLREGNVLCTTASGHVMAIRCSDWVTVWKEQGHRKCINDLALHPSGALGITVSDDAFLKLWNFASCKLLLQVKLPKPASLVHFAPAAEAYFIYSHPEVVLYDMNGKKQTSLKLADEANCVVALTPSLYLFGLENGCFEAVSVAAAALKSEWTMEAHTTRVRDMSISTFKARTAMVSVCSSGSLAVWECDGGRKPVEVKRMNINTRFTCVSSMWK